MSAPLISVLVPFKNTEGYMRAALESLVRQTEQSFEVLLVDDDSTDNSRKIAEQFCRRCKSFRLIHGGDGLVASLNTGLEAAEGKWIARFDSDDVCHPERLAFQLRAAEERGRNTVVSCRVRSFPDRLVTRGYRLYERWINSLEISEEIEHNIFVESPIPHPTAFYSRSVVIDAGGYLESGLPEDYELWLRLWSRGGVFYRVPRTLLAWRERRDRFSRVSPAYSLTSFYKVKAMYLQHVPSLRDKKVFVVGAGQTARRLGRLMQREGFDIEAFVSPYFSAEERLLVGKPIIDVAEWLARDPLPLIVALRDRSVKASVIRFLIESGLSEWNDFVVCA